MGIADPPEPGAQLTGDQLASAFDKLWHKDWSRIGTREAEAWFTAQVRGTAPEPPPSGFLVPPGLDGEVLMRKLSACIEVSDELLMDYGAIPDTRPPYRPPWRTRLRWKTDRWRTRAARRAYKIIDGDWPDDEPEDW